VIKHLPKSLKSLKFSEKLEEFLLCKYRWRK